MSRIARTRLTGASLLTGALIGTLALSGCGAGQVTSTAEQMSAGSGANAETGPIAIRDAVIVFGDEVKGGAVYTRGADAPLSMTITNQGGEADRIIGAGSPWATEVVVGGTTEIPAGRALVVEGDVAVAGGEAPGGSPTIAPNTAGQGGLDTRIVLRGLLDDIRAGVTYEVVLEFERAGEVRVQVPVGYSSEPRKSEPHGSETHEEASE